MDFWFQDQSSGRTQRTGCCCCYCYDDHCRCLNLLTLWSWYLEARCCNIQLCWSWLAGHHHRGQPPLHICCLNLMQEQLLGRLSFSFRAIAAKEPWKSHVQPFNLSTLEDGKIGVVSAHPTRATVSAVVAEGWEPLPCYRPFEWQLGLLGLPTQMFFSGKTFLSSNFTFRIYVSLLCHSIALFFFLQYWLYFPVLYC